MSSQTKSSKGKGKGARRVSNLSEEQRNKKRENDRIAQQNIRRRNKELIERLQQEVELLRRLKHVDVAATLLKQNKLLQDEVRALRREIYVHTGRAYPVPGGSVDGVTPNGFNGDYSMQQSFGPQYLAASNLYEQWPNSVVPMPSTATVHSHSPRSSPGASAQGDDFTPGYVHSNLPMADGTVMASTTSAGALEPAKGDYREIEGGSSSNGYSGSNAQQHSSPYLHEPPWPPYHSGSYYPQPTTL